jgi:hypothetical protein
MYASKEPHKFALSTDAFAARQQVQPQSVRSAVCRTGHYFGVRPLKLANGRLAWPDVQLVCDSGSVTVIASEGV